MMKRKWAGVVTAALALLLLSSSASTALAQSEGEMPDNRRPVSRVGLAIVAPRMSPIGEEVSMTVFERKNQNPVGSADIWAVPREKTEDLKAKIAELREESENGLRDVDWNSLVGDYGFLLGTTQGNGRLMYTFTEIEGYLLIAIKQGYLPGRTFIAIKDIVVNQRNGTLFEPNTLA